MLVAGTVILVLGVAFFVKYAFDSDWINETARVAVGTVVGLLLWGGGLRLIAAGYQPYGRVITGGGLAIVYISAYAAHALYDLVPAGVAFTWMVAVSAATATTADRQRSLGLALSAIVLAYFAPLLVGRDGSHLTFFAYILALGVVTWLLTRRHDWPALGLSALYLTVATTVMWVARSFSSDIYASTEVYLTAALVLFVIILRTHRSSSHPLARVSRGALLALPVLYHVASLAVLYPHSVAYLGYLILGTTVAAAIPAIRNSPRVRLAVWAAVSAPFYAWLINHTSGVWYTATIATAVGIYLLHLITQFLTMSETDRPANAEIALFHANGLSLFVFTYIAVDANAGSTPLLATSLAVWNGAIAWGCRGRIAEGTAQALALAFALAATAIALALAGAWITVGWAAEGAAVIWIGLAMNRRFFRHGGAALLALATVRLIALQFPGTIASHQPIINSRVGAAAFIVALLYGVAALYRRYAHAPLRETRVAITAATVAANALTVLLITAEIRSFWELRERRLTIEFARLLSVSLAWAELCGRPHPARVRAPLVHPSLHGAGAVRPHGGEDVRRRSPVARRRLPDRRVHRAGRDAARRVVPLPALGGTVETRARRTDAHATRAANERIVVLRSTLLRSAFARSTFSVPSRSAFYVLRSGFTCCVRRTTRRTTNDERRTQNAERANAERRTKNDDEPLTSSRLATSYPSELQHVRHPLGGIELHVVPLAAPGVAGAVEQIDDVVGRVLRQREAIRWQHHKAVLHRLVIEIDDHENRIRAVARDLAEREQTRIVGRAKHQSVIRLQRRILAADAVDRRDEILDVVRVLPIPVTILVLLRVQIFLAAGHRPALAQFESAVDAVGRAERRRQDQADPERRRTALLQIGVQDVRRVGEEIRAEELRHLGAGELGEVLGRAPRSCSAR